MAKQISTFLMFDGKAEEAMTFYVSLFDDAEVGDIKRYGAGAQGVEGSVMHAAFTLKGQHFMCIDSAVKHQFGFTPAISIFVDCESEREIDHLHAALARDGMTFMPLDKYPFAEKFAWIADRFGVSWQLRLSTR